jgi:alkylation response protein AidB-like acyl-CoA dehydrogenase
MIARENTSYLGSVAEVSEGSNPQELVMALEMAERLMRESRSVERFRASRGNIAKAREVSLWQKSSGLGLIGICAPAEAGGAGLSPRAGIFMAETIGRNLAPEPFIACSFLPSIFLNLSEKGCAAQLLHGLAEGAAMPVVAIPCVADAAPDVEAVMQNGRIILNGVCPAVHGAAWATHFIVAARSKGNCIAAAVAESAKGLKIEMQELADGSFRGNLRFENVEVDQDCLLADGVRYEEIMSRILDFALVAISAELFGIETALLGLTIEYLKTRTQFDRLIGSFQALQHRAVDLYCNKEIARFVIADAIHGLESDSSWLSQTLIASRCKARTAASAYQMGREAVQMHGAIGFSDECNVGLYVKRALVLSAWFGSADSHRRRYARLRAVPHN